MNVEDLEYKKSGLSDDDLNKLDGTRAQIEKAEILDDTSKFAKDGQPLPEGQERAVQILWLVMKPFGEAVIGRNIEHRERFNLQEHEGKWVVSLHEKAKTAQFLAKYGVDSFANVAGKEVVIVKKTSPKTGRSYLTISI